MSSATYLDAALRVLKKARRPLHYENVARLASIYLSLGDYRAHVMAVVLAKEATVVDGKVRRVRRGVYALRSEVEHG